MNESAPVAQAAPLPSPAKPRRWPLVLLGLVILVCGMAIGAGLTLIGLRNRLQYILRHPEKAPAAITARLRRRLDLSDEQAGKVEAILRKHQLVLQEIRREVQPRVEAELDLVRQEVASALDERQAERWREQFDRLRRTWLPPAPPAKAGDAAAEPVGTAIAPAKQCNEWTSRR